MNFAVDQDFVARLKLRRISRLKAPTRWDWSRAILLPLGDFAKAFDGPPTDPRQFEKR